MPLAGMYRSGVDMYVTMCNALRMSHDSGAKLFADMFWKVIRTVWPLMSHTALVSVHSKHCFVPRAVHPSL